MEPEVLVPVRSDRLRPGHLPGRPTGVPFAGGDQRATVPATVLEGEPGARRLHGSHAVRLRQVSYNFV